MKNAALVALLAVGTSCAAGRREADTSPGLIYESTAMAQNAPSQTGPSGQPERNENDRAGGLDSPVPFGERESRVRGTRDPVVLVTIDGARWQEIFEGTDPALSDGTHRLSRELVPALDRMAREQGAAVGAPGRGVIAATGPNFVSLPGYTEILTGRSPLGCQSNDCEPTTTRTVLDEAHASGGKVAAFASWERLERAASSAGTARFLVSCGRHGDPSIEPWPGEGDFRPDRYTADLALDYLEREQPDVLYLGLGEPDEYAHHGDYPGYLSALAQADAVVGRVFDALERMGTRGARTHVVVTADHGRAADFKSHGGHAPESARVWFVASGPSVAARGRVVSTSEHHLADVAPTLRVFLGLAHDRSPYAGHAMDELFVSDRGTL